MCLPPHCNGPHVYPHADSQPHRLGLCSVSFLATGWLLGWCWCRSGQERHTLHSRTSPHIYKQDQERSRGHQGVGGWVGLLQVDTLKFGMSSGLATTSYLLHRGAPGRSPRHGPAHHQHCSTMHLPSRFSCRSCDLQGKSSLGDHIALGLS